MTPRTMDDWLWATTVCIPPLSITPLVPEPERREATTTELLDVLSLAAAILEAGACIEHWACSPATLHDDGLSSVVIDSPEATHFCLEGAIVRAAWELDLLSLGEVTVNFSSVDWITLKPLAELMEADLKDRPRGQSILFTNCIAGWWDHHGDKRRALALLSRIAHQLGGK